MSARQYDCFAQKGFQLAILESAAGLRIYIVNTHLDAGQSELDRLARASQLDQIALALEADASSEAVLIVGDLNLDFQPYILLLQVFFHFQISQMNYLKFL